MDFSTANSGLPSSRTDALSVVVLGLISAFIGATPTEGKRLAMTVTTLANLWAIVSSVLTLLSVFNNPHDIESHLWLLLLALLCMTVVTSVLTLLAFVNNGNFVCGFAGGILVVVAVFLFGLVELLLAYTVGCNKPSFKGAAMCKHSTNFVVGVVVGVGVGALVGGCLITFCSLGTSGGVVQNAWRIMRDRGEEQDEVANVADEPHSRIGAILTRTSALTKACLLGIYWFLVDSDFTWDYTVHGNDLNWWVTGQWAKQGTAIANNFLNCLY